MFEIVIAILSAVAGAILKWLLPMLSEWWRVRSKTAELLKEWYSHYEWIDKPSDEWVSEKLVFSLQFRTARIKINNSDSSGNYDYTGIGELSSGLYIHGEWRSIRSGANADGAFILTISAQGDMMYGYWVGSDKAGARRYGRWVLAETEEKIKDAKALLNDMRNPYHQDANET